MKTPTTINQLRKFLQVNPRVICIDHPKAQLKTPAFAKVVGKDLAFTRINFPVYIQPWYSSLQDAPQFVVEPDHRSKMHKKVYGEVTFWLTIAQFEFTFTPEGFSYRPKNDSRLPVISYKYELINLPPRRTTARG